MVLDVDPEWMIKHLGHDGEEVWWPEKIGAKKIKSFHIQEIIDIAHLVGWGLMPIQLYPCSAPDVGTSPRKIYADREAEIRFMSWLDNKKAILIVDNSHAVAWDGEKVYDPKGFIKSLEDYSVQEAWVLFWMI